MENEKKSTVLVVDDTKSNIDILVGLLYKDYDVRVAISGKGALDAVAKSIPDIILLDILMPEMDGYEVCRILKQNERTSKIPVIFISAIGDVNSKVKSFSLGGVDYISKPFSFDEVQARIKTHLDLANALKEVEDTLSKTLTGTISMLLDILSISNPELFSLSTKLHQGMKAQCRIFNLKPSWAYELAAMLLPLGLLSLSPDVLSKIISQKELDSFDIDLIDKNTDLTVNLLSKIPKMELPRNVIKLSIKPLKEIINEKSFEDLDDINKAAVILRILRESMKWVEAFNYTTFVSSRLEILDSKQNVIKDTELEYSVIIQPKTIYTVLLFELKVGVTLVDDLVSDKDGKKILASGYLITDNALMLIEKYKQFGHFRSSKLVKIYKPD